MFSILLAEDDVALNRLLAASLRQKGYQVEGVTDGVAALEKLEQVHVDLLLTDIMMPHLDGFDLVSEVRASYPQLPILMMTAKSQFESMEEGFSRGADDYLVKPFRLEELHLRLAALLRRARLADAKILHIGHLTLDYGALTVADESQGQLLQVPKKEFYLLYKLLSQPQKIFTRLQLLDEIWGMDTDYDERVVDACVKRIRKKFQDQPVFEILTVRGLGYKGVIHEK